MSGAKKFDSDKVRLDLVPSIALFEMGKVFTLGAKKYGGHNWRKGLELSRLLAASLRHIELFLMGEDNDPEWDINHLSHALAELSMALETFYFRPDLDDRYKLDKKVLEKKLLDFYPSGRE